MSQPSTHIITGCKKGNRSSQKELYYLSKDRVKSIALRYCNSIEDAKDVVQESYLKIYKNIQSFNTAKGNFNAWSARIVVNEALMLIRKKKQVDIYKSTLDYNSELANQDSLQALTLEEVKSTINSLNKDHQVVLNMHYFEEFTYKEMSKLLNLKESSVRSKVSRAKAELAICWRKKNMINYEL